MLSTVGIVLVCICYLSFGTVQTVCMKWAFSLTANDRFGVEYSFQHPLVYVLVMFCAEFTCLPTHYIYLFFLKRKRIREAAVTIENGTTQAEDEMNYREPSSPTGSLQPDAANAEEKLLLPGKDVAYPCNPLVFLAPAFADFAGSVLQNIGLTLTYASVYQMLRGSTVVFIAILSFFWLRRHFVCYQITGMLLVVIGLTFVGASTLNRGQQEAASSPLLGNLFIIAAQVLHAYQGVSEERIMAMYRIPPLQMVGMEGMYGIMMTTILLAALQLEPFYRHGKVYDDVILAFDQAGRCMTCLLTIFLVYLGGYIYNACQLTIIKNLSAAACVMLGSLRNVSVWLVCLLFPAIFNESLNVLQLIGFSFLVAGNVYFQNAHTLIPIPCCVGCFRSEDPSTDDGTAQPRAGGDLRNVLMPNPSGAGEGSKNADYGLVENEHKQEDARVYDRETSRLDTDHR